MYLPTERTVLSMRRFLVVTTNASVGVFLAFALFALDKSYRPTPRPELPLRWGDGHGTMSEKVGGMFIVRHGKRRENKVRDPCSILHESVAPACLISNLAHSVRTTSRGRWLWSRAR